jgi:RNA polymerase sigma-70 factor, ECF subfamily
MTSRDLAASVPDEASLVAALKARDPDAFETLVRLHAPRLLAVSRRMLDNEEDARDAVQDALVSAFRSIDRFQGQSKISTWLHRIVVNMALMRLRTRRRKPEEPLEPLLPVFTDDGHHAREFTAWDEPVDRLVEREETRRAVREAVAALPDQYRDVLLLRDIQELDTNETARELGVTPNAVKIRLHRARQALRTKLDEHLRRGRP